MVPTIAISMGDFNGIGPEVALKTLRNSDLSTSTPLWIGSREIFQMTMAQNNIHLPFQEINDPNNVKRGVINIFHITGDQQSVQRLGSITKEAGEAAMKSVDIGIRLCLGKKCDALVTSPISKEAIFRAGYTVPGHTEFLAEKTGTHDVVMILISDKLRIALSTIHIPLKHVSDSIKSDNLIRQITILNNSLIKDFDITAPRIALLGLNPHAGDGGVLGSEELDQIIPSIRIAEEMNMDVNGPFSADGYFASEANKNFDATLAMYHDQGLIPFKTLSFGHGVNFTAGLPIIRTSPDHGTAFEIAGQNLADERSFTAAYEMAIKMVHHRNKNES